MQGQIKRLFLDKGFGFLKGEDGTERFFHRESCLTSFAELREGDTVTFIEGPPGRKGPRADRIQVTE